MVNKSHQQIANRMAFGSENIREEQTGHKGKVTGQHFHAPLLSRSLKAIHCPESYTLQAQKPISEVHLRHDLVACLINSLKDTKNQNGDVKATKWLRSHASAFSPSNGYLPKPKSEILGTSQPCPKQLAGFLRNHSKVHCVLLLKAHPSAHCSSSQPAAVVRLNLGCLWDNALGSCHQVAKSYPQDLLTHRIVANGIRTIWDPRKALTPNALQELHDSYDGREWKLPEQEGKMKRTPENRWSLHPRRDMWSAQLDLEGVHSQ